MLFFTGFKLVAYVLACAHMISHIRWRWLICCISRMNQWIELIFHMLIHGVRKAKIYFRYAHGQIWLWPFRSYTISISIICVSQKEPRSSILKFEDKILIDNIIFISKSINNLLPPIFKNCFIFFPNIQVKSSHFNFFFQRKNLHP